MKDYHLLPNGEHWELAEEGGRKPRVLFGTKSQAVERAREIVAERSGSLKIHREDGTIEEERTYPRSADPVESRG